MVSNEKQNMQDLEGLPRKLNKNILVYPIKLRDAIDFYECVTVLMFDKNANQHPEILKMSYLKFVMMISQSNNDEFKIQAKLLKLLSLVLKTEQIKLDIDENGDLFILVDGQFKISEFGFDKLKTIISEQNMINLQDKYVNPELKEKMRKAEEFLAKKKGKYVPFDQRVLAYKYVMRLESYSPIFDMTLYQFNRELETISHIKNADVIQQALYSGMVSIKDESKIPYWLSEIKKEDPLIMNADKMIKDMTQTFE